MAGCRAVEEMLKRDPDRYEITIFGAEPRVNYNRIMLSPVLAGEKTFDDIVINDAAWYDDNGITLHAGDPVEAIDRARQTVPRRGRAGSAVRPADPRHRLRPHPSAAAGRGPRRASSPSATWTMSTRCSRAADAGGEAVVIGGGLLGLEAAYGLSPARHEGDRRPPDGRADGAPARRSGRLPAHRGARRRGRRDHADAPTEEIVGADGQVDRRCA